MAIFAACYAQLLDSLMRSPTSMELANTPKLRLRTKHLSIQLHHFWQYALIKTIAYHGKSGYQVSIRELT